MEIKLAGNTVANVSAFSVMFVELVRKKGGGCGVEGVSQGKVAEKESTTTFPTIEYTAFKGTYILNFFLYNSLC
ncbi:hypothetical protein JNUCC1_00833 [Lentibacillus sp. JNUCC-1]|uniref:hypothetical protein n=1 Tax=Lentibacillus sp. JNUCC-1 TaxID=2654513 RepID=UPI0012E92B7E|nr:hypothetical protein [Lentibacillus sp. JNUCC-1]MUV37027.1 hypothetical protein [Lentibacillus sp. JNUCC-1]